MSKKLIAVASAAALALSALVAVPAMATAGPFAVAATLGQASGTGLASGASALNLNVPSQDIQRYDSSVPSVATTTGTLARVTIKTTAVAASVNLVATAGTKLLTKAQGDAPSTLNSASGEQTLTVVSDASADAIFYVSTTTTANTTVTATQVGTLNAAVIHVRGISAKSNGYKLALTGAPTSTSPSGTIKFSGTLVDMFGNPMLGLVSGNISFTGLGGNADASSIGEFVADATTGAFTFEVANRSTAGTAAMNFALHADVTAAAQTRFGSRTTSAFFSVTATDLTALVTSLQAQVAALQVIVDRKVSKKRYNTLARKWNAANPSAKVTLKK